MQKRINRLGVYLKSSGLWLFALAAEAAAILILSVIPSVGGGINGGPAAHFLAYTTFSCTAGILLAAKKNSLPLVKGALIAALYGGGIELVQSFIPYRACEFSDFATNCIAAVAGMAAAALVRRLVLGKFQAIEHS